MLRPRLFIKPTPTATRLYLSYADHEVMRAALPPPQAAHPRAALTLCEGLSLWLQRPLSVALYADAQGASCGLGLCDGLGFGVTTAHCEVEVVDPGRRRRALGSFRDLRQLELRGAR
ncbi:MAG: hypothetical protein IT500_15320 [Rubrivivax sp.]|nr:hypothetical protein [Rubrivivax sp.]